MLEKLLAKAFGPKLQTVIFHMKSGNAITFKCEKFTANHDSQGCITAYNAKGVVQKKGEYKPFWVSLNEIESITLKK